MGLSVSNMLMLSNSFSPGKGPLHHALDAIQELLPGGGGALFIPYAGVDPDTYADAMQETLAPLGINVLSAHRAIDPLAALEATDLIFVGGGNSFRLLQKVQRLGMLELMRRRVFGGVPYIGVSAGANLACPTIRTTNDPPVVQPNSLEGLSLVPFQINPHYPFADSPDVAARIANLNEFLHDNDAPILALCEGSWLRVTGERATIGGTGGGRLFRRGAASVTLHTGDDLSALLGTHPRYDIADYPS